MRVVVSMVVMLMVLVIMLGYFTMLERKVLGYGQIRKGPNKSFFLGVAQPIVDGVKLMMKGFMVLEGSFSVLYMTLPMFAFMVMVGMWVLIIPILGAGTGMYFMLILMVLVGVMVVLVFLMGVFSGSKFAVIGAMRGLAQMVSYEILLGLVLVLVYMEWQSFSMTDVGLLIYHVPVMLVWWVVCVVEANRSPVDFLEGESELVSGFNVEFGSVLFALMFMGEYGVMSFYSVITVIMFLGSYMMLLGPILSLVIICLFVWWRLTFPRYRYDLLMGCSWGFFLPILLVYFLSSCVMVGL